MKVSAAGNPSGRPGATIEDLYAYEAGQLPLFPESGAQQMNLPDVKTMYPDGTNVRRIDISIGEKAYWGRGIGTTCVRMLIDLAFSRENVDVLHCICEDYNVQAYAYGRSSASRGCWPSPCPSTTRGDTGAAIG
jgi:hypothetical protein